MWFGQGVCFAPDGGRCAGIADRQLSAKLRTPGRLRLVSRSLPLLKIALKDASLLRWQV
jgi:hypothetical protein